MSHDNTLQPTAGALERRDWKDIYERLTEAEKSSALSIDELERLACSAYLLGKEFECDQAWIRAYHACIREGDPVRAARCAFQQACGLNVRGATAPADGWIARGRTALDETNIDCAERGWLLTFVNLELMFQGNPGEALPAFVEAAEIGARFRDPEVMTMAGLGRGHSLIMLGEVADGMKFLDELMVAVTANEVTPIVAGLAYCAVVGICLEVFDLRRGREWTAAFSRWCEAQGGTVAFRGNCFVERCEILKLQGSWPEARDAAVQACALLTDPLWDSLGSAYYQLAEIERLHGEFATAEEAYDRANKAGHGPEPGISLLRLAQGRIGAAVAGIQRAAREAESPLECSHILPAFVEIMLAAGDVASARSAADELASIATEIGAPYLHAIAACATGAVLLAEGDRDSSLDQLRAAWKRYQELEAPYEAARVRVLIARALEASGDSEGATRELDGARWAFEKLGAAPDLARIQQFYEDPAAPAMGLSPREIEVLCLLASGKSNREISAALVISEHTVARHVQNIFAKIGVSSRTGAAAFAFEHDLVSAG